MQFGNSDQDRSNVEDRRGSILSGTGGRLGLGGIIVLGILSLVFKQNLFDVVQGNPGTTTTQAPSEQVAERQAAEKPLERVSLIDDSSPWERAQREGWEGVIAKRRGSIFVSVRTLPRRPAFSRLLRGRRRVV